MVFTLKKPVKAFASELLSFGDFCDFLWRQRSHKGAPSPPPGTTELCTDFCESANYDGATGTRTRRICWRSLVWAAGAMALILISGGRIGEAAKPGPPTAFELAATATIPGPAMATAIPDGVDSAIFEDLPGLCHDGFDTPRPSQGFNDSADHPPPCGVGPGCLTSLPWRFIYDRLELHAYAWGHRQCCGAGVRIHSGWGFAFDGCWT